MIPCATTGIVLYLIKKGDSKHVKDLKEDPFVPKTEEEKDPPSYHDVFSENYVSN